MDRARALARLRAPISGALCAVALCTLRPLALAAPPLSLIGVDLPLAGNDGGDGLMAQEGVALAVSDWNAGAHRRRFGMVVRDTSNGGFQNPHQDEGSDDPEEPLTGVASLRAFAANPAVAGVVGAFRSDVAQAEAPVAHALGLPVISGTASSGDGDTLFRLAGSDEQFGFAGARAARDDGYTQVAIATDGSPRALVIAGAFQQAFSQTGGVTAVSPANATFFAAASGPAILALPPAARAILTPGQRALFSTRGYQAPVIPDPYEVIAPAGLHESPAEQDVARRFEARFMEAPSDVAVAFYAATQVLLDAAENSARPDRVHTLAELHRRRFTTVLGDVAFGASGVNLAARFARATIVNGRSHPRPL
jgi:ABC-type branched-subunit amino acid transport system substrate-binding protein